MSAFGFRIDRVSPEPVYKQLASQLKVLIERDTLKKGEYLPSEFELATKWGVSRPTVRHVINELVNEGLLARRHGVGTSVLANQIRRVPTFHGVFEDIKVDGRKPQTEVTGFARIEMAQELCIAMEVPVRSEAVRIQRLRSIDGFPLALLSNLIPFDIAEKITRKELGSNGLYELLERAGHKADVGIQKIGARVASPTERRRLALESDKTVLTIDRVTRDKSGRVIDLGNHVYSAEKYFVEMSIGNESSGEFQ